MLFRSESRQIETALGIKALVSLSDHDDINAGMQLRVLSGGSEVPVSVEWTIPFGKTFFHIGVHNLAIDQAPSIIAEMNRVTAAPDENEVAAILHWVGENPETLVVFNHPAWDENHVGPRIHHEHLEAFLSRYRHSLHAVELNGLRPWKENRVAAALAAEVRMPLVSGGDRHGREPNACVNVTNAASFGEFVREVRGDGYSEIVFMPQYRESLPIRIIENMGNILDDDPEHAMGWLHWSDRVFYETDTQGVKSLAQLWGGKFPSVVNQFVGLMHLVKFRQVRSALRMALNDRTDFVL